METNFRKWVAFLLSLIALIVLGAIFYILVKSGTGSTGQPAFPTGTSRPDLVDQSPSETAVPDPFAPSGPAYVPPSMRTPIPYPYPFPISAHDATVTAITIEKQTDVVSFAKTMTAEPTMNVATKTALAKESAAYLQWTIKEMKQLGAIMLEDNGRTYTYYLSNRFFVFLDDEKYPVSDLHCEPEGAIGYISNGSFRGPDFYPIYFEAGEVGSCTLKDRDFSVKIVVVDLPTLALTPQ
jgi:hypothetical protein